MILEAIQRVHSAPPVRPKLLPLAGGTPCRQPPSALSRNEPAASADSARGNAALYSKDLTFWRHPQLTIRNRTAGRRGTSAALRVFDGHGRENTYRRSKDRRPPFDGRGRARRRPMPDCAAAPATSRQSALRCPRRIRMICPSQLLAMLVAANSECGRVAQSPARRMHSARPLRFDRKQRYTLHAELLARALRVVGDELVLRIVLHGYQVETCARDHLPIIVLLCGAADAGGP